MNRFCGMKLSKGAPLYWLVGLLFITAWLSLAVAFFVDPEFVARYLSPDGVLSSETVRDIQRLRIIMALMAIPVLLTLAVLLRGGHAAAQRVVRGGHAAAQRVVSRVRPLLLMERPDWLYRSILSVVLLIVGGIHYAGLLETWESARGAEYRDIAHSIAEGHGFSTNESNRWFWSDPARDASEYATDEYYPTAIEEPLYPLLLGTSYRWFGESGAFAVLLLQLLAWLATCALVYAVGRRALGRTAGLLAGVSLALWPSTKVVALGYLGPAPFGGLLVVAIAYQTIRTRSHGKLRHDVLLGVLLGVATLTLASSQVFIPLSAASVVFLRGWNQRRSWLSAFAIIVCAAAVIAPWTVRNWQVFGEFVPVRTGLGLISHQGNPVIAATYHPNPQACTDTLGPMWSATGPGDAVRQMQENETEIYKRSFDCIAERAPDNFVQFNEAQRDQFYLAQTMEFVKSQPLIFAELAAHKYRTVVIGWRMEHTLVGLLGILGALLALKRPAGFVLTLMVAAFIVPYALGVPWKYRYRYPIEPLLLLLTMHFAVCAARCVLSPILDYPSSQTPVRRAVTQDST